MCGDSNGAVAPASSLTGSSRCCDDPGCTAPTSCPRHSHHEVACAARALTEPAKQLASDNNPVLVGFDPPALFCPATTSHDRILFDKPPDLPVGSARSLPLLI